MEIRCAKCNKMLTIVNKGVNIDMETKCPRCGSITVIIIKSVQNNKVETKIKAQSKEYQEYQ
jgi:phage FluMu protein Com